MESQEGSTSRWWTPFCLHADDTGVDFGCAPEARGGGGARRYSSHFTTQGKIQEKGDFPGGPVVKNLPCNAGDQGSIPGRGPKVPHAMQPLSPHATVRESDHCKERFCRTQSRPDAAK